MENDNAKLLLLLTKAKLSKDDLELRQISHGGNNKTFRVVIGKDNYIFKEYFKHENDLRDRLLSEYSFLNYAEQVAPGWTPRPLCQDVENGCALYEFIEGQPYSAESISIQQVMDAAQFFVDLNDPANRKFADELSLASESCFSITSHIDLINRRLDLLYTINPVDEINSAALIFVKELKNAAEKVTGSIIKTAKQNNIDILEDISCEERCVSPSDFGFHNAIRTSGGSPKFIDFEYAGWDDPAKMVSDFFAQIAIPIPNKYFEEFVDKCLSPFSTAEKLINRSYLLAPLYKIKWCCIALNVFLPVSMARRKFANSRLDENEYKIIQIEKARNLLNSIGEL